MGSGEPLLDVAVALSDGAPVDWDSAARSVTSEDDRGLLAELRFIADMARLTRADSSGLLTSTFDARSRPASAGRERRHSAGESWGPLKIIEHVGRGTFGDVYRAWDSRLDREVALKILRHQEPDDQAGSSTVIEEGRLLARVRHPNVVTVYGAERIGREVGVWMEFVHGKTVEQQLREEGPFDVDRVVKIGVELSGALSTVHRAGLIHRDVKAQNVLCDRDGRLVLTDFGAGCEVQQTTDAGTRDLKGTPLCVAPEVLAGQSATPSSDVYSLGVLLYHLVTGTYPVRGRTLKEVREAHANNVRTSLAEARPDLPNGFVRTVNRALDPHPDNRYPSPAALGHELASQISPVIQRSTASPARAWWRESVETGAPLPLPPILDTSSVVTFVGRTPELNQLAACWARAQTGQRQLVLVSGEPGIGKTRLSLTFARTCADAGATVLVGRSDEEALVPYQPVVEALTWYTSVCPDDELRDDLAASGSGSEVAHLVPDLLRRRPDLRIAPPMSVETQRYRLFEAVNQLLRVVAARRPLLLILEDLHWADKPTLLALRHLARAQQPAAICIIGTYRESDLDRGHPLGEMLAELHREPAGTRLSMRGLTGAEVRDLVATMMGPDAVDLAPLLHEITGGNPFFVGELLRHLKESGAVERVRGRGAVAITELGLPEGIRDVIGRRLARTTERCQQALTLAAVVGREFDLGVLKALGDLAEDHLLDALDEAVAAHLIGEAPTAPNRFSFLHALIRETVYAELSSSRRRRLHQRVGEVIERLTQAHANPPLADLAYHFIQAAPIGSADKAIDYATRAGDRAADALASEEASRFYGMALHCLEFSESANVALRRVELHTRRARAFGSLAQWANERREVELALESLPPDRVEQRAELLLMLADSCFYLLDIVGVRRFAAEGYELAHRADLPDLCADALGWIARCQQAGGDLVAAVETDRKAIAHGRGRKGVAIYHSPHTLYLAGHMADAVVAGERAAEFARTLRDPDLVMYGLPHYGLALGGLGRFDDAFRIFGEARRFGRKYGVLPLLARATAMEAGVHLAIFDLEGAEALQREAQELARSLSFAPTLVSASIDLLFTMARRHDPGSAELLLRETVAAALSTPGWHEWLWKVRLSEARAELALARDEPHVAIVEATAAIEQSRARSRRKYEALGLATRAAALQRLGQTKQAIADACAAASVAREILDPALQLHALGAHLAVEGSDELAAEAVTLYQRIRSELPDDTTKQRFDSCELVRRIT